MTDAQRAHTFCQRWVDTPELDSIGARQDLAAEFEAVRADERTAVYADITRSVRLPRSPRWEEA